MYRTCTGTKRFACTVYSIVLAFDYNPKRLQHLTFKNLNSSQISKMCLASKILSGFKELHSCWCTHCWRDKILEEYWPLSCTDVHYCTCIYYLFDEGITWYKANSIRTYLLIPKSRVAVLLGNLKEITWGGGGGGGGVFHKAVRKLLARMTVRMT